MLLRTTSIIAIMAGLGSIPALGADLPSRKGPEIYSAPPLFTWTGFYLGGSIGYIQQNQMTTDVTGSYFSPGDHVALNSQSALVSANAGYNYQFGSVVLGVETDIGYTNASASASYFGGFGQPFVHTTKLSSFGTVRARLGYAFDRTLFFATGGFAYANLRDTAAPWSNNNFVSTNRNRMGWTAGGGVEYAVTNNWTIKAEALYANFGTKSAQTCNGCRYGFKDSVVTARAGVNYKF